MKIIMYGAEGCPDCVAAKDNLEVNPTVVLDFRDITKSLKTLKEFLFCRDHDEVFAEVKKSGGIGIPFFILDDQTRTFEINDFIKIQDPLPALISCSADGKKC